MLLTTALWAQSPRPQARIQSAIDNARRLTLPGSLRPQARPQFYAGAMPATARLQGITMEFNLSAAQQADLNTLLAAQQNPASPLYHHWLTPDQFGARFGMSASDLAKVGSWLEQQGFTIAAVSRSRTRIRFSGTVAQVESAFSAPMHFYQIGGVRHFAPATALSLPAAIEPTVLAIGNLDDFRPRPRIIRGQSARPNPRFTSSLTGNVFFAPGDIATTYDVKPLYASGYDGAGQTIAVVGQSAVALSDIENFQNAAGLTVKAPSLILVPGSGSAAVFPHDEAESDLDLEWAGAVATGANVDFVYVGNNLNYSVSDALTFAVDQDLAPIIDSSYGNCEAAAGPNIPGLEVTLQQAAAQGQTVIAASGDEGSTDCYGVSGLTTAQQEALAVDYPASSAYVTGVGGTEITAANAAAGTAYWQASSGTDVISSALKYIPEIVWNDDSTTSGLSAGGGGSSTLFDKPGWQTGVPGIPADGKRDVPDLALYASPNNPGYLYCTSDSTSWVSGQLASCDAGFRDAATEDLTVAGGTSFDVPTFAGMVAIINQEAGYTSGQGLINPTLYSLAANSATYALAFHDVTSGNNDCTAGPDYCSSSAGFSAGTGYDQVTGLGSVDLNQLALAWPLNTGPALIATTTTISASSDTPAQNANVNFTITVSGGGGPVPTGTVSLFLSTGESADNGAAPTQITLSANGTAVYPTSFAAAGVYQLLATYSGDSTYARSTGVVSVNVPIVSSGTGSFTIGDTALTIPSGGSGTITITVTPSGGYTGTVLLSLSKPTALENLCYEFAGTGSNGDGIVSVSGTTAATTQITLDANAAACSSGALNGGTGKRKLGLIFIHASGFPGNRDMMLVPALLALAGLLFACVLGGGLRRYRLSAGLILLLAVVLIAAGCSGGNTLISPPPLNYTITVTGEDSTTPTISAHASIILTIN
ncbi:MAG: protease pro-enzyme activation domain-containing protein [Terriglobales bacterium]